MSREEIFASAGIKLGTSTLLPATTSLAEAPLDVARRNTQTRISLSSAIFQSLPRRNTVTAPPHPPNTTHHGGAGGKPANVFRREPRAGAALRLKMKNCLLPEEMVLFSYFYLFIPMGATQMHQERDKNTLIAAP